MTITRNRNMNADLATGMTEGSRFNVAPDWGGQDDTTDANRRATLLQAQYKSVNMQSEYAASTRPDADTIAVQGHNSEKLLRHRPGAHSPLAPCSGCS
jgi:hypothetical protein